MHKSMKGIFAVLIVALVLPACEMFKPPPTPQTPREALALAEIYYQGALATIKEQVTIGTIQGDDAIVVQDLFQKASVAMAQARLAVKSGATNQATTVQIASSIVNQLVQYLSQKKGGG